MLRRRWWLLLVLVLATALCAAGGQALVDALVAVLDFEIRPSTDDLAHRLILISAIGYTTLIAIPFVPGVELGLAVIGLLGPQIVPLIYLCTLFGLATSFAVGRLVPLGVLARVFERLSLHRGGALLHRVEPLDRGQRLAFLVSKAPGRLLPLLIRHRYVALALVFNLPGNFLVGGGGGIALIAGATGLYSVFGFLLATAVGVAPLPLLIMLFGAGFASG